MIDAMERASNAPAHIRAVPFRITLSGMSCNNCGGPMRAGAVYTAVEQHARREFPALECARCGAIEIDVDKIAVADVSDLPSSVRLRCERVRGARIGGAG
jgi:hypothetical protein